MEFNDLLRESHKYVWGKMQLNGGMGNIKRNPGGKKREKYAKNLLVERPDFL